MGWPQRPILVLGAFIFISQQGALAYPTPVDFDGTVLKWDLTLENPNLYYEISAEADYDLEAFGFLVDTSANLWSLVDGSLLRLKPSFGELPQLSIILRKKLDTESLLAGFSIMDEKSEDGKPIHCEITILADDNISPLSIGKTLLHEMGHCLGLGHSLIPESIMSYNNTKNRFALDLDDKAALSRLYPKDGTPAKIPLGCGEVGRGLQPLLKVWVFVLLALPLAFRRRRMGL